MEISVVIPVYGCKGAVFELHERLVGSLEKITDSFEIIMVNDNCPQNSWEEIKKVCYIDKRVRGINLSRNFGQIKAITAGLDNVKGNWVVVMDCDLQDRPEEIINLYNKAKEGYDVVFARRANRQDKAIKKFLSKTFYKVYGYFTDGNIDNTISNFSISKKIVIKNYCEMREQNRAFTLFIKWLGFKQTAIDVDHNDRAEGESSYSLKRRLKMAFEIITAQSNKPLTISITGGAIMAIISFLVVIYRVAVYFLTGVSTTGWTSIIVSIYLVGGLILMNLGILGIYIGNIFNENKNRPLYVIKDYLNKKEG
ncbi:glycosyltransferase [Clostridium botulinum B str. Eklund 17B (NRP)]|uniref:Glycosyltransferase n=1 Tax=Clostridium botulinum (strain Eklund 17B / Type B) TaxID=935198 RepID=B2TQH1_CLOBB|nr:glycosyltransferase family 2 protein [Clostridium sp. M14]ACD21979.1 glycosyltransferase [Clostridium botulinum B str. Eklund 17B (NRP)]MBY6975607.1 glycosyltransferase family 2 protein [Clostridium botulinum]MBY7001156.1 glycosyltransferase family 2 protein [Clostridium botulinum]MBZ9692877.1 glycosyltransferase family 2 protein [Clostridium sp. M14]MCR1273922.1 glycosyltransferase family 2 protein [Clostridium botulinum]